MGLAANRRLRRVVGWLGMAIWLVCAKKAKAQVVINEFLPDPEDEGDAGEWIELYNLSNKEVNLGGWWLDDIEGGTKPYSLPEKYLPPEGIWVIEKFTSHIGLNNTSDEVRLMDNSLKIIDAVFYENVPEGKSYGRQPDGDGSWQILDYQSKGNKNQLNEAQAPTITDTPTAGTQPLKLQISEVYACPKTGENEWIELVNLDNQMVRVDGIKLIDSASNQQSLMGEIGPKDIGVFEWERSFINNGGDEIKLISQEGSELDHASLPPCTPNTSLIMNQGVFVATLTITKKMPNQLTPPIIETSKPDPTKTQIPEKITSTSLNPMPITNKPVLTISLETTTKPASAAARPQTLGIINMATLSAAALTGTAAAENPSVKEAGSAWLLVTGGLCLVGGTGYSLWRRARHN